MSPIADLDDLKIIGFFSARINVGISILMYLPALISLALKEWNTALDFAIAASLSLILSLLFKSLCRTSKEPSWSQGLAAVALSWILATFLGALPYYFSGFMGSYLDACFDVMSGFTTTGLFLMKDLDHIPLGLNIWRHVLSYLGGQGIVIVALSLTVSGTAGLLKLYVGEGREEKLLPNVTQTARMIWIISLVYLVIGTSILTIVEMFDGLGFWKSLFHGACLFMGAWSTGGFAPQSPNLIYYHSWLIDLITLVFFVLGSFNFALHYAIWSGQRKEIWQNIETRSFIVTLLFSFFILSLGLHQAGTFPNMLISYRRAFYIILSAHTTTGNMSIYARQLVTEWGHFAMLGICIAMSIGACACSTGGGFKSMRVGIVFKSLIQDIRRFISPEASIITQKFHHIREYFLDNTMVRNAMMIVLLYLVIYILGTIVGLAYGYPAVEAFFESISAGSNSGLSCGITSPSMPAGLKFVYIIEMWLGRLEFVSVLTFFAIIINALAPRFRR